MEKICRFCLKVSITKMCSLQECDILFIIQKCLTIKIPTEDLFPSKICKECFKKISLIIKFCITVKENEDNLQYYSKNGLLQDYYSKITNNMQIKDEPHEKVEDDTNTDFEDYDHLMKEELSDDNNKVHCSSHDEITLSSIKKEKKIDDYDHLVNEELSDDNNKAYCSSDDEITLSLIKKEKDIKDYNHLKNKELSDDSNKAHCSSDDERPLSSIKKEKEIEDYDHLINEELSDDNKAHCSSDKEITLSSIKKEKEINTTAPIKEIRPLKSLINSKTKKEPENIDYIRPFTCLTCLTEFNSQADLTKHYYAEHYRKKTARNNYTEHKLEDKTTYSCDSCEKIFNLKKDIVKHVMSHTGEREERPLICKFCARTYRTVPEIVRHARAHNGFKLQCPYNCGFTTAYQGAMKEHKNRHLDKYKYTCKTCGKGFNIKTWYEQHQNLHTGEKPFVCNICGVAFPLSRYLQTHKSSMHPQSSSLKRYRCVHCDEKCDSAKSLALHLQEHGINKVTDFLCDFCGKILTTAYQLEYHHRMHLGVKPYSCTICKKKFAKKYNVQLHMSVHTGDRSHSCSHCGKRYSQRSTLLRHLKRYHGSGGTSS